MLNLSADHFAAQTKERDVPPILVVPWRIELQDKLTCP
jgi:hypothetical protein